MQDLSNLISICNLYKEENYGLEELQSRIITASIPENLSKEFLATLVRFDNQIEEIIFCQSPSEHKKCADNAIKELVHSILLEQERLKGYQPYKAE